MMVLVDLQAHPTVSQPAVSQPSNGADASWAAKSTGVKLTASNATKTHNRFTGKPAASGVANQVAEANINRAMAR
jgi:hypothetical protein